MAHSRDIKLKIPMDLKHRLEYQAQLQGVSLDQFALYLINREVTQMEMMRNFEAKLSKKDLSALKRKAKDMLARVPKRRTAHWDTIDKR